MLALGAHEPLPFAVVRGVGLFKITGNVLALGEVCKEEHDSRHDGDVDATLEKVQVLRAAEPLAQAVAVQPGRLVHGHQQPAHDPENDEDRHVGPLPDDVFVVTLDHQCSEGIAIQERHAPRGHGDLGHD